MARIEAVCGRRPPIAALLEGATIEHVARALQTTTATPAIPRRDRPGPLALSFTQQWLWLLDRLDPDRCVYNVPHAVRLHGPLRIGALRDALETIVARHEALRTTFVMSGDAPVQVVLERAAVELPVVDLSAGPPGERDGRLKRLLRAEARRPFNLAEDLMLRAMLVRLGEREHVLLLTVHHIASDEWSMGILARELRTLYAAISHGHPANLSPLPIQYGDYAVWQRQRLQGAELARQLAYWKDRLAGAPTSLDLPTDRRRPAVQTYRGARETAVMSRRLSQALSALGRQERVTGFMTLLAAFETLLHRYTGQDDLVVGSPIAGRRWAQTEPLIGCFVNTLALRADLSGDPPFREFLDRVRGTVLGAYDHEELPFERLVEELRPERSPGRPPLVQVMFIQQGDDQPDVELPGLAMSPVDVEAGTAKFDLTVSVRDGPEGLRVTAEYKTDLYDAATIRRMLGHYEVLLEGIVADPGQRLSMLPLLTAAERHELLVVRNATHRTYSTEACVHELVAAQAARTPEASAVVVGAQELSYGELDRRANQLGWYLRERGVGPDVPVGIYVERAPEMVVGLLGILKAGGAYVPLDPALPRRRLAQMLEDTRAPVVMTQRRLQAALQGRGGSIVRMDVDWAEIARQPETAPPAVVGPGNLAYIIYTSGSTGLPKGVAVAHGALVNLLWALREEPGCSSRDALLAVTSLSFDIAALELYLPLIVGARVILADRRDATDGERLRDLLASSGATVMQATPSTWSLLLAAGWNGGAEFKALSGGEAMSAHLASQLCRRGALWNMYGPTETTVWSSRFRCEPAGPVALGLPIANTQFYVLDVHRQPVPIGVPGELYVGGAGLARGYLHRADLTAERFIPDPFSGRPGARLYKTGDRVRSLPDRAANMEFLGRADGQVKIRGHRVEPEEIEVALLEHPAVRQAAVIARADGANDTRLVAYIVAEGPPPGPGELRRLLRAKLPDYMVPAAYIVMEALPQTTTGKADRRALPPPATARPEVEAQYMPPRTPIEEVLVAIWADAFGVERIGVHDDFFELGGHSLLATRLVNAIERAVGLKLPLSVLFACGTVHRVAEVLDETGLLR